MPSSRDSHLKKKKVFLLKGVKEGANLSLNPNINFNPQFLFVASEQDDTTGNKKVFCSRELTEKQSPSFFTTTCHQAKVCHRKFSQ
jgi:hypothetical protein